MLFPKCTPRLFRVFSTQSSDSALASDVNLPLELIYQVLDNVYTDPSNSQSLAACALVCKVWRKHAQHLLFRDVRIGTRTGFFAYDEAVTMGKSRGISFETYTEAINIVLDFSLPNGLTFDHLAHLFRLCPNARHLNLTIYGCTSPFSSSSPSAFVKSRPAPSIRDDVLRMLQETMNLRSLTCTNWSTNPDITTQVLGISPDLKTLHLRGNNIYLTDPNASAPRCSLEDLNLTLQPCIDEPILRWILRSSSESLKRVEIGRGASQSLLCLINLLGRCSGSTVEELSLPCWEPSYRDALTPFLNLQRLHVHDFKFSTEKLHSLPSKIKHLSISIVGHPMPETVAYVSAISAGLESLRVSSLRPGGAIQTLHRVSLAHTSERMVDWP